MPSMRRKLMVIIAIAAAAMVFSPNPAAAGGSSADSCSYLGCGGGGRMCADISYPDPECEAALAEGIMCCPNETISIFCYERAAT